MIHSGPAFYYVTNVSIIMSIIRQHRIADSSILDFAGRKIQIVRSARMMEMFHVAWRHRTVGKRRPKIELVLRAISNEAFSVPLTS